jgi:hypothetical protein
MHKFNNAVEFESFPTLTQPAELEFVSQFKLYAKQSAENVLEMCKVVFEAHHTLSSYDFSKFCTGIGVQKGAASISKMKKIGERYELFKTHSDCLPSAWTTLYRLATMTNESFAEGIEKNIIATNMTAKNLNELVPSNQRTELNNSAADQNSVVVTEPKRFGLVFSNTISFDTRKELEKRLHALCEEFQCELTVA